MNILIYSSSYERVIGEDQFDTSCLSGCNLLEEKQAAPNENAKEKASVEYLLRLLRQTS